MSQRKGIHTILEFPFFYEVVQKIFSHSKSIKEWFNLIKDCEDKVILDVGCGPGKSSQYFTKAKKYVGIDISKIYIEHAKLNYSDTGDFFCIPIEKIDELDLNEINMVVMNGVLHHLSDEQISNFLEKIKLKMSENSFIVSCDPVFTQKTSLTNYVVSLDRGTNIRSKENLLNLLSEQVNIISHKIIKQNFPPYQRIFLKFTK